MIYSIEDQIKAVNLARKTLKGSENVLNEAANTLESIRLMGIEKVMHAKEMYDLLSRWQGSAWLNEPSEVKHGMVNEMMDRIWKYRESFMKESEIEKLMEVAAKYLAASVEMLFISEKELHWLAEAVVNAGDFDVACLKCSRGIDILISQLWFCKVEHYLRKMKLLGKGNFTEMILLDQHFNSLRMALENKLHLYYDHETRYIWKNYNAPQS